MKLFKYILILPAIVLLSNCSTDTFEELAVNPNQPTAAPASLIFNGTLNDMYESPFALTHRWNQYYLCNYNYYGNNEYNWTSNSFDFYTLKNVSKMVEENEKTGADAVNVYSAMAKFQKAYLAYRMTMKFGNIPFSEALQGAELTEPKYDDQKQVFVQILNLLDEANNEMNTLITSGKRNIDGDIYFNGDLTKWQQVVNAFKLRVLIQLSNKTAEADLRVKERFAEIVNNPAKYPIVKTNADALAYKYISGINNYPLNPGNEGFDKRRYNLSATHLNKLVSLKDPRTFVLADPAEARINGGMTASDFGAYVGADPGESLDDMTFKMNKGEYSAINQKRYYGSYGGPEPGVLVGYIEMAFNIAEGMNRGWAGDANTAALWYKNGILASLNFYGINDASTIDTYFAQSAVNYKGQNAEGLKQILEQRYLGLFNQAGFESYYNWRRTGVPTFTTGVGTGNGGVIPLRWQYPTAERTANKTNYNAALSSQFGGQDDINAKMWIIK